MLIPHPVQSITFVLIKHFQILYRNARDHHRERVENKMAATTIADDLQRLQLQDQGQAINILDLNDHCLLEVFSHLRVIDLCAVKDCCERFVGLAISTVKIRFENDEFVVKFKQILHAQPMCLNACENCDADIAFYDRPQFEAVLKHFGQFIDALSFVTDLPDREFWLQLNRLDRPRIGLRATAFTAA